MVSVGAVIGGAFRLFRERPGAVAIWGLIYAAVGAVGSYFVVQPLTRGTLIGVSPGQAFAALIPYYFGLLLVMLVLSAASVRAVLRPEERSFASLRIGMDEVRLFGLAAMMLIAYFVFMIVFVIIISMLMGVMMVGVGAGMGAGAGSGSVSGIASIVVIVVLLYLVILAALSFVWVRFSLVGALTILRRKIIIGESWTATRRNFWRLFAAYLVIGVIMLALYVLAAAVTMGPYLPTLIEGGFSRDALQEASQAQMQLQMGGLSPALVLSWIAQALIGATSFAMWGGAAATATQALVGPSVDDYAATFE
ncbi:MAG: hypothetical protein V4459_00095 [Pseudomonadota bacterium]